MIRRLKLSRDLIDALREWNARQLAARNAYAAGPTRWCWVGGCLNPAARYCRGHGSEQVVIR